MGCKDLKAWFASGINSMNRIVLDGTPGKYKNTSDATPDTLRIAIEQAVAGEGSGDGTYSEEINVVGEIVLNRRDVRTLRTFLELWDD